MGRKGASAGVVTEVGGSRGGRGVCGGAFDGVVAPKVRFEPGPQVVKGGVGIALG